MVVQTLNAGFDAVRWTIPSLVMISTLRLQKFGRYTGRGCGDAMAPTAQPITEAHLKLSLPRKYLCRLSAIIELIPLATTYRNLFSKGL